MSKKSKVLFGLVALVVFQILAFNFHVARAVGLPIHFLFHGGCVTSGNQTISANTASSTVTATPATGGYCEAYQYQWQVSIDNIHFYDIQGATSQNLTYGLLLSHTVYFQRKTTCGEAVAYTNSIAVTIGIIPNCTTSNCYGADKKCINDECETGLQVFTESYYDPGAGGNVCVYHYEWSDGSWSGNYYIYSGGAQCFLSNP